jgi:hypothetical protein
MLVGGVATRKGPPAAGTRRGQPRSSRWATHGDTGPLPGGKESGAPETGRSGLACDGLAITRGGSGPPRGVRDREAPRELSRPPGCAESPDLM